MHFFPLNSDVGCIVGFGKACEIALNQIDNNYKNIIRLRDKIIIQLPKKIPYIYLNGHPERRLPNNVNFSIVKVIRLNLMVNLSTFINFKSHHNN